MRVSDSYVSLGVIILAVFATRKSTLSLSLSLCDCLMFFSFDGRLPCMPHPRFGLHETSLSISWSLGAIFCEACILVVRTG